MWEHEKEAKGNCGFKRAEEENQTDASGNSNKSQSSYPQNRKETNPQDNKEVTSSNGNNELSGRVQHISRRT